MSYAKMKIDNVIAPKYQWIVYESDSRAGIEYGNVIVSGSVMSYSLVCVFSNSV